LFLFGNVHKNHLFLVAAASFFSLMMLNFLMIIGGRRED